MMMQRLLFVGFLGLLLFSRTAQNDNYGVDEITFTPSVMSSEVLKVVAGHLPGLVADFKVLNVFSVFAEMQRYPEADYGVFLYEDLAHASVLDPAFQDIYRLASSLLAFDANMPEEAVQLLEYGTYAVPSRWEMPFLGGFIAYEQLQDSQKAFELMSIAAIREHAPPSTPFLAARYLRNERSAQDTIVFLQSLQQMMPEAYQAGIQRRINELKDEMK